MLERQIREHADDIGALTAPLGEGQAFANDVIPTKQAPRERLIDERDADVAVRGTAAVEHA
jgi:hypothetical protein